jgi:ribosomal-protein-alanine N-acetyltransferase
MKTPFIVGERIYFRPLEREDAPLLRDYINDPEVTRTLTIHRPINLETEVESLARLGKNDSLIFVGICLKENDRLIGALDLRLGDFRDRHAVFGISIGAKDEWNKGYGTEATKLIVRYGFQTLNLNRISLRVYEFNPRAMRTYEKCGFVREGVLRQEIYRDGRFWDAYAMGILRSDWDALNK